MKSEEKKAKAGKFLFKIQATHSHIMKNFVLLILSLVIAPCLLSSSTGISFAPVLNESDSVSIASPVDFRYELSNLMVNRYDCRVFSRSNGLALLEEQRYSASVSEEPSRFPYPPAADYIIVTSIRDNEQGLQLILNYSEITGQSSGDIQSRTLNYSNEQNFLVSAPQEAMAVLAEELKLPPRKTGSANSENNVGMATWVVLPFQVIIDPALVVGDEPEVLRQAAESSLVDTFANVQVLDAEEVEKATAAYFVGATERKGAEIGHNLGTDFLIMGSLIQHSDILTLTIQVVRCIDASVIASKRIDGISWADIIRLTPDVVASLAENLSVPSLAAESDANACVEEAQILYGIADRLAFTGGSLDETWYKYLSARTLQASAMIGQDTDAEDNAVLRMDITAINHPNLYQFHEDWRTLELSDYASEHNAWVINEFKRMAGPELSLSEKRTLLELLDSDGRWEEGYTLMQDIIQGDGYTFEDSDRAAAKRIRMTSLSARLDEANAFIDQLNHTTDGQFSGIQTRLHHQRNGNESQELARMVALLEEGKWTTWGGFPRLCQLLQRHANAAERVRVLNLVPRSFRKTPSIQVLLLQSHQELGNEDEARDIASILLARGDIGNGGYDSQNEFKAELRKLVGKREKWPAARAIQVMPEGYRMYLQPVGEYPEEVLQAAAKQAGEFFGCEFIVRPSIPKPTARSVYYKDMIQYVAVPLLRRFITARPPPEDAIYQVYLVDQRFLVYGRGPTTTCYRKGLGFLLSYEPCQRYIDNNEDRARALANGLIYGFRFFIERPQEIWHEDSPNNFPCINSRASSLKAWERETGYCPECTRNYLSSDMEATFRFHQMLPHKESFSEDFMGWRHPIDDKERASIRKYAELVGIGE